MKYFFRLLPGYVWLIAGLSVATFATGAKYQNPVIPGDHPDPSIIRVGKDYWATCTSSEWGPQFPLLHSTDLVNWKQEGSVFLKRPEWAVGNFWAPEISEYKGKYFIYYVGREKDGPLAVAVATADKPGGPYTDHGPMVAQEHGSIDPVPCVDESGRRYLVWKDDNNSVRKPTTIWAQPLTEDGTKLTGEMTALITNDTDWEGGLVEAPFVLRRGEWFYLFYAGNGCCGSGCSYAEGVARSHSLLGPWEKNPMNPIIAANLRWKCPGHGSIVADEKGRYWFLYHAYPADPSAVYTGREAMLDEVVFGADGWPTVNQGKGPSIQAASPFGVEQKQADLSFDDEFKGSHLRVGWEWPQGHEPGHVLHRGQLILSKNWPGDTNRMAVLAHATRTANYTATTVVDAAHLPKNVAAGICGYGDAHNAIGVVVGDGRLKLWRRDHGNFKNVTEAAAPKGKKVFLRLTVKDGYQFHFAASAEGKEWIPVGDNLAGKDLPPWDRSVRVALTVEGTGAAEARFDAFHLTPAAGNAP